MHVACEFIGIAGGGGTNFMIQDQKASFWKLLVRKRCHRNVHAVFRALIAAYINENAPSTSSNFSEECAPAAAAESAPPSTVPL